MNRIYLIFIFVVLLCVMMVSCVPSNTADLPHLVVSDYVGMDYDTFSEYVPEHDRFDLLGYSFFEDVQGNPCVAFFSGTTVSECRSYPRGSIDTSARSFKSIEPGMTMFDVVEKVGLPDGSFTFGMATVYYETWRGVYTITIDTSTSPATVQSVELS